MKNHRVLIVFILSLAFLLTSSGSVLMAGNCTKAQQQACCPSGTKAAKCDPAQCKTDAKCDPAKCHKDGKCDPAQCKTGAKCDPAHCKGNAKCDKSKCSTAKASTQSTSTACPHSKVKDKKDPSGT